VEWENLIDRLKAIVGENWVTTDPDMIKRYLADETPDAVRPPPAPKIAVVKPANTQEVSEVLKLANQAKTPVFVRGGGTGLAGGCVPTRDGIVLSMERMDKIEIDRDNLMAVAEAGVTLEKLIKEAEAAGLFFPLHPGDEGAQVGGLVACNAGGARAVKTGVMRNYVKGLEVVLPDGRILSLGGKLVKDNASKLLHLFIGTEGILGVITKATLRLYPRYAATATLVVPFDNRRDAIAAVPEILRSGVIPLAVEYVDRDVVELSAKHLGMKWPCQDGNAFLIFMLAEPSEDTVYAECETISDICSRHGSHEPLIAESSREQAEILKIRSEIYTALKPDTVDILDAAVPPASMGLLIDRVEEIARKHGVWIPVYGHVGDGNLHCHIMKVEGWSREQYMALEEEIYRAAASLGGVVTGEHGVGETRKKLLSLCLGREELELIKQLKKLLDPNNILNPGKVVEP